MKKFLVFALTVISINVSAQEFEKGTNLVSAGIGFGGAFGGYHYSSQSPGISLQYERGIVPIEDVGVIGIGGYIGYKSRKYESSSFGYYWKQRWNYTIIGARGVFHLTSLDVENLDVYGGVMLSYNILSYTYEDNDPFTNYSYATYPNRVGFSIYGGGRYYVAPNIAGFLELGYGISYLNLGITARF